MKKILGTQTVKDSFVVTLGMGISTVLSALSIFCIARILGPMPFGLYVSSLAIAVIVTDSLELAISNSLVKFAAANGKALSFIKYGFYLKLFLGLGLGSLMALGSQLLADLINPALSRPLLIVSSFIPVLFLYRFPRSLLQAKKRFVADSLIEVTTSFLRLVFILLFYFWLGLTVELALLAYVLGAFLTFIIGAKIISWKFLNQPITNSVKTSFFNFQKWLTLGFIIASIHGRIDTILLVRLSGPEAAGIYQAAFRFFMPVIQLSSALSLVFAPRFASFNSAEKDRRYLIKAAGLSLGLAILSLLLIPLSPWLVRLIFGFKYEASISIVQILALGFAAFLAGTPFSSHLIYSSQKIKVFFWLNLFQLIILTSLDFILMPRFGSLGAAWAMSITLIIINSFLVIFGLWK